MSISRFSTVVLAPEKKGAIKLTGGTRENHSKLVLTLALAIAVCLGVSAKSSAPGSDETGNAALAFERLKTLAGRWEATTEKGKVSVTYELVSGGSAVLERLEVPGKESPMLTVYHLDGNRLLLTHYCHAGNQPRMRARTFDSRSNEIDFDFVSATNLASPVAGHMHQLVIRFNTPNEIAADWTWYENGKAGGGHSVSFVYRRVS